MGTQTFQVEVQETLETTPSYEDLKILREAITGQVVAQLLRQQIMGTPVRRSRANPYLRAVRSTGENSGLTLHSRLGADWLLDDTRLALQLPGAGETTVWRRLSPEGRRALALRLAGFFQQGVYDRSLTEAAEIWSTATENALSQHQVPLTMELRRRFQTNTPEEFARFVATGPIASGFSPLELLRLALTDQRTGVCRHANVALAGILGELGIPAGNIRLVLGSTDPNPNVPGHIWIEYRVTSRSPWIELDATARERDPIGDLFMNARMSRETVSLYHTYRYHRHRLTNFLVPIPAEGINDVRTGMERYQQVLEFMRRSRSP